MYADTSTMEVIKVTARFDLQGEITPVKFTWNGRDYVVDSTGRRWKDEIGTHFLVMIPGGHVFELLFVPAEEQWYLGKYGTGRMFA